MTDPPENSKFDRKSGSRNTPELPPSESDFWDLEDEGNAAATPITPEPRAPAPSQGSAADSPEKAADTKPDKDIRHDEASLSKSSKKDGKDEITPQSLGEAASNLAGSISKSEKMAIIGVGVGLLLIVIWALSLFFSNIHTESPDAIVEFPVEGDLAIVSDATTYWRDPNPDSDRGVRKEARLIPAGTLTLESESKSCALRVLFVDDAERIVGDAITLTISNGQFSNGSNEIEVYATEGFTDEGDHAAYLTEQIGKWYLVVKEGPDSNSRGSAFTEIFRVPISNSRH